MGIFAPAAAPLAASRRAAQRGHRLHRRVALFGLARAAVPGAPLLLLLTLPIGIGMAIAGALLPIAVKERFPDRPAFANGVCTSGLQPRRGGLVADRRAHGGRVRRLARRVRRVLGGRRGPVRSAGSLLSRGAWTERRPEWSAPLPVRRPVVWMIVTVFALQSLVYYGITTWVRRGVPGVRLERRLGRRAARRVRVLDRARRPADPVVGRPASARGGDGWSGSPAWSCRDVRPRGGAGRRLALDGARRRGDRRRVPALPDDVPRRRARARRRRRRRRADVRSAATCSPRWRRSASARSATSPAPSAPACGRCSAPRCCSSSPACPSPRPD